MIALYDGDCSLCLETKKWFQRLDWLGAAEWLPLQEYEKSGRLPRFRPENLRRELHIINRSGNVLKGFKAARKLLLHCPLTFLPALLLYLPGAAWAGEPAYRVLARNRHRLNRGKCKSGSCTL